MIEEDDLAMDVEDGWDYSMPPSLESLPLVPDESNGKPLNDLEGDEESVISELEDALNSTVTKKKMKGLRINTTHISDNDKQLPSIPIDIQNPQTNSSGFMITTPPKQMAMPAMSSVGSSYSNSNAHMMKSTPADPLTTVEEVHNKSSPSKSSYMDTSSSDEKNDNDTSSKMSNTIYQLQQTISENSIHSKGSEKSVKTDVINGKSDTADSTPDLSNVDVSTLKMSTVDSNASFFSSFRNVAQSMLLSPSGSHSRTASETIINVDPSTPVQNHRRTVSTASSSFIPTVSEEGGFKLVENGDHHPDIISYRRGKRPKSSSVSSANGTVLKSPSVASDNGSPVVPNSATYDKNLYIDEFYKETNYRYATLKRNADFHNLFVTIPIEDRLLDDFSCAWSREILIQGRIYVSENYIAFNSNILGWITSLIIPFSDVINIEKKATAGLFNNGIAIETKDAKHYFATFLSRDATFQFFNTLWEKVEKSPSETSSIFKNRKLNLKYKPDGIGLIDYDNSSDSEVKENLDEALDLSKMTMSLDGDTPRRVSDPEAFEGLSSSVSLRPDSGYHNDGPTIHPVTAIDFDAEGKGESILFVENISVPPGLVFDILFGENTEFHRHLMELSEGSDFTSYSRFEEKDGKMTRDFSYVKALGYSIGPKSTKVNVVETIEQKDYDSYINVLTTSVTPDVPSGNVFSVNTRYLLSWGPSGSTNFQLSYFIKWTGKSWIKGIIEAQTKTGQKEVADLLLKELKAKLDDIVIFSRPDMTTVPLSVAPAEATESFKQKLQNEVGEVENTIQSFGQEISGTVPRWLAAFILVVLFLQVYTLSEVRTNNALIRRQIELTELSMRNTIEGKRTIKDKLSDIIFSSDTDMSNDYELDTQIEDDAEYYNKEKGKRN